MHTSTKTLELQLGDKLKIVVKQRKIRSICCWHSVALINFNNVFKASKTDSRNLKNFSLLVFSIDT